MQESNRIIGQIYEAAIDPQGWEAVLTAFADSVHAQAATLNMMDLQDPLGYVPFSARIDPSWVASYREYYHKHNILVERAVKVGTTGRVLIGQEVVPDAELVRSEIYQDWFRPQGMFHVVGGIVARSERFLSILGVHRPQGCGAFSPGEVEWMQQFMPHLAQADRIQQRFATLRAVGASLDQLPFAIFLVSAGAKVLFHNRAAQDVLDAKDGLQIQSGRRLALSGRSQSILLSLISRAAQVTFGGSGQVPDGQFCLERPSGLRSYVVSVSPVSAQLHWTREEPGAMVLVLDPCHGRETQPEVLGRLFGLTRAEAAVAAVNKT